MSEFSRSIDQRTIDYYIRRAHAERADAFAAAFAAAGRQIKSLFSSPEPEVGCGSCPSKA